MFYGVILLAAAGAVLARFEARGMGRALLAAALAQALAAAVTLYAGWALMEPPGATAVIGIILFFAAAWLAAAGLFWRAARDARAHAGSASKADPQSRMT
jgi:hypothetical protein